ncbi:hypothetical protein FNH22_01740 [Fulvivirga sp. M361]|uniref:hypothetical protein n=1 Tax=Fulvivirga sp. M361 TaxID=2594266 RepID=UPI00117B5D2C|nr:hypothetical protein [Fulvivirga sp. M361]TRX62066.1 hypothetical protein FNH22_01740 [Fulvivirga sp. M361]
MKDELEKFITVNRQKFDTEEPSEGVWNGIIRQVSRKKNFQWLWKAAAITFFLISVFLLFKNDWDKKTNLLAQKEKISSDFNDIESFYFEMISQKKNLIDSFEENIEIDYGYEQDLQNLDAMYEVLKDELQTNPSKKVVDALLLNLVVRIDILNKKLAELEEDDEGAIENNDGVEVEI